MLRHVPLVAGLFTLVVAGPAVAQSAASHTAHATSAMSASTLRVTLNVLFRDHVFLAAGATGAALGGRDGEFAAAAASLDANSVAIANAIGSVYGEGAQKAFLPLWRKHIGFVVDYTVGLATKDRSKQDRAVANLVAYTEEFGAFLASANPNLPKVAVAGLVKDHVLTLKAVIDAQGSGNPQRAWSAAQDAANHMAMIADPLAAAIATQFPAKFAK